MIKKISLYPLIVIIIFFVVFSIIALTRSTPTEIRSINYTFTVKDALGFNLDTDKLHFGGGPSGVTLQRTLDISSTYDSIVEIETVGPGFIVLDKNNFKMEAGENTTLTFNLLIPQTMPQGAYEGTIYLYFYES